MDAQYVLNACAVTRTAAALTAPAVAQCLL